MAYMASMRKPLLSNMPTIIVANFVSFSLTLDPSWFLNNDAINHVIVNSDSLLQQLEYQGNNKLVVV